ncbi:MAG: AMP-binding protein [Hadesarchaea archaeon]|nr:AMP-binding protein [Hadesarchaea archaeon]
MRQEVPELSIYPKIRPGNIPVGAKKYGKHYQPSLWPYYPEIPLFRILKNTAMMLPDKAALLYPQKMTYKELDVSSNGLATALTDLSAKKGNTIALYMWNSPKFIIAFFGALKSGATVTALNPAFKEKDAQYQLEDSESMMVIVDDEQYPVIKRIRDKVPRLKNVIVVGESKHPGTYSFEEFIEKHSPHPPTVKIDPKEDLAVIQYTGGTTGLPKGCMLTHYNITSNIFQISIASTLERTRDDIILAHLPFYHIYGMTSVMGASIRLGISMVIMKRFDLKKFFQLIEEFKVTSVLTVMPVLTLLANSPDLLKNHDLSSLRFINNGGTPIVPEIARSLQKLTGVTVVQGYGLSEASPVTHENPLRQIKIESVGPPIPDTEQKIVDPETGTKELPPGEVGEVIIRGPQVMKGYWKRPEATAKAIRDGWLYTGDLGKIDEDDYLYIVDRKKEIIKYKGFTIGPAEIEAVLYDHPAVADCAVVGKPDPVAGEIPKAFVALKDGAKATEKELINFVEERVAGYKKIREVEFVETVPRNLAGKVLRREFIEKERNALKTST